MMLVEFLERSSRWKNVFAADRPPGTPGTALGGGCASCVAWTFGAQTARRHGVAPFRVRHGYGARHRRMRAVSEYACEYLRSKTDMLHRAVHMLGEHKILAWMQGPRGIQPAGAGR